MSAVAELRSPEAIRERCAQVLAAARRDALAHFRFHPERLGAVSQYVVETIEQNYPGQDIPYHSRWRHFGVGGRDRWDRLRQRLSGASREEIARTRFDLVVISVLVDAGAGPHWRYREPGTGVLHARSEGLAVASLELFSSGTLSSRPGAALRADRPALEALGREALARVLQITPDNPMLGLDGRLTLLRRLGAVLGERPDVFGDDDPRVGGLFDFLANRARNGRLAAREVLTTVLDIFAPIWPGRLELDGVNLGDIWRHPVVVGPDPTSGLVPFHKLSQWLTYSLVEPLEDAGIVLERLDELTGLAEYRNGGLFVDLGVLEPRDIEAPERVHEVGSELVVEWRALTVALLDELAPLVRRALGRDDGTLSLAKILEGGTWSAGRRIAAELRADASPPIRVDSDGTVF